MNQIMKYIVYLFCTLSLLNACGLNRAYAYDTAPRITDREIVESLVELKQGQKNINQRFEDMNININQRFEDINQRFEDMNQRFEELHSLILTLFGSVMALIVALIGYMIWDRKSSQQPLRSRLHRLENEFAEIEEQFEMRHPSGSVIARVLDCFRKLAETDSNVTAILRTNSLL